MLFTHYDSPIGRLFLASEDNALIGLWIEGQKYFPSELLCQGTACHDDATLLNVRSWLDRYFAGEAPAIDQLNLSPQGSEFRRQVWKLLCAIPYGQTVTYGAIGKQLEKLQNKSVSAQAIGGAVGHNPISIIIPCHRVIGADGSLTGYAGGLDKKAWLLTLEGVTLP